MCVPMPRRGKVGVGVGYSAISSIIVCMCEDCVREYEIHEHRHHQDNQYGTYSFLHTIKRSEFTVQNYYFCKKVQHNHQGIENPRDKKFVSSRQPIKKV